MRAPRRWISLAASVLLIGGLTACATRPTDGGVANGASSGSAATGASNGSTTSVASSDSIQQLPTGTKVDYQLGGSYAPPAGVGIVTRDSTSKPAPGLYNICYINGFQTQDYEKSFWLTKHPTLVLRYSTGKPIFDPGWPDEMILDASTATKRTAIAEVQKVIIDGCRAKGFQAVEFDNLDSYSRSHHQLTLDDDIALATLLVEDAHADGLAAGQKNTAELGSRGKSVIHYDFAVSEECYTYDECASYTSVYGPRVIDIEYTDDLRGSFASNCSAKQIPAMTILRDRDLTTPRSGKYVYKSC